MVQKDVKLKFPQKLQLAAKAWQILNQPMLKHEQQMIRSWTAGFYDDKKSPFHTINLIGRGIDTVVPFLVEGDPRFMVETKVANYRPWAYISQLGINFLIRKMKLAERALVPAAFNSMFGAGITKTCMSHTGSIVNGEEIIKLGHPTVTVISNSNYIGDPSAKRRQDFGLEGDVYTLPTEYAKDFFARKDEYGNQVADYIIADGKVIQNYSAQEITKVNFDRAKLGIRDTTTFIDLYLYDENIIVTIMPYGKKAKILRTVEWEGPEGGPYDYVGYKYPPDTAVPLPPAWSWDALDTTMNEVFDKTRLQAEGQKTILAYEDVAAEDADRIVKTPNTGTARVNNIQAMKEVKFLGPAMENFKWMEFAEAEFTKQGGNPDVLGGRGASAPTLGQEQLVYNNATRIIRSFVSRWNSFVNSIGQKLIYDFSQNPLTEVPVIREIPGYNSMPAVYSNAEKVGDFNDFVYTLVEHSMSVESPEIKYQKMMQFMTAWILPTIQFAAAQGNQVDIATATRILSEYAGFDNFNQWYTSAIPHELNNVPYTMKSNKSPGQTSDSFGATPWSRQANNQQQQTRAGGMSSPENK